MMSDEEQRAVAVARIAFDSELAALGEAPIEINPFFREGEPLIGIFPTFYLEKPGVAPFCFVFSSTFEVWLGPFPEVVVVEPTKDPTEVLHQVIRRTLCSVVSVRVRRSWTTLTFSIPPARPWWRLRVWAKPDDEFELQPHYDPFALGRE